ncbi:uncharacterized protein LOC135951099 [Calliphora vicina]|uniref:uncharacterized protein LOC135951099 n=1 Tax=Calliphora vicina TaxID=7373 RepID=UPI00325A7964
MKLLHTVLILGLIQLLSVKPLLASSSFRNKLVQFYDQELLLLSNEFCEKAKSFCEKILQDEMVQQPKTPKMREFKQNITDFLQEYTAYKHYGLINELVLLFEDKIPEPSNDQDSQYIWQLLRKLGYHELSDEYENNFQKFAKQKFLPKFEELKLQLSTEELKQHENLLKWFKGLKQCQDYKCDHKYFSRLLRTPKEQLFGYVHEQLENINIYYGNNAYNIAKAVLKDQRLKQLNPAVQQNLTNILREFIGKYESNHDVNKLFNIAQIFYNQIILKFYYNPLDDQQLLVTIFDDKGYVKFESNYLQKFNDFVQRGFYKKFEEFKNSLGSKELANEKPILEWFQHFKGLTEYSDRVAAFEKLSAIE